MNILVLNGSPRPHGNTAAMVAAFAKGAQENGHPIDVVNVCQKKIAGCLACEYCHRKDSGHERQCVQQDDMNQIYPAVRDCDVIVLASPLYYWNMSGQLRTAVDRLFALEEGDGNLLRGHGRASALLMAAEGNGFEDVLLYYNHLMEHLKWENLGHVLAGGNGDIGDIDGKPELGQAYELGKSIR